MNSITWIFKALMYVGNAWMALLLVYNLYLSLFGFKKDGRAYARQEPEARFLILVPAHNEERVIEGLVRNLMALDYPKALYDFYIIADNCTDRTAEIARQMGASVIETKKASANDPTGKPIALRKALEALPDYAEKYDLLMIFDADNLMDNTILSEVNSQYVSENKPEIIQCYLGTKNREGLVAMFYHVTYTITNRFMNLSKYRLGLNVVVGGTGFAIQTKYLLKRGGWTTESLTEDFEMQVDVSLSGGRILWNHNVRIYDEKPTNLIASFRQRVRWSQGHWFVAIKNTPRLFGNWRQHKVSFVEMLSLFTYMYSMSAPLVTIFTLLSGIFSLFTPLVYGKALAASMGAAQAAMRIAQPYSRLIGILLVVASSLAMLAYSFILLYVRAERLDNRYKVRIRSLPYILLSYLINLLNVSVTQIVGLARHRQQDKWVKTSHKIQSRETVRVS